MSLCLDARNSDIMSYKILCIPLASNGIYFSRAFLYIRFFWGIIFTTTIDCI